VRGRRGQIWSAGPPGKEGILYGAVIRPAEHGAEGGHQDVMKAVRLGAVESRIDDTSEMLAQAGWMREILHPEFQSNVQRFAQKQVSCHLWNFICLL